ncbi:MAG: TonB-dependent receptor [Hyphomonas sp.]
MKSLKLALLASCLLPAMQAIADEATQAPVTPNDDMYVQDIIHVWGRAIEQIGEAQSASEGVVGYDDFALRPLARPGELVEVIPGMIATQHSGGGKANQYYMRGFNLDHGTDFAGYIDGVPLNLRSHAHMSGYLDLNFIIPELVETVSFQKGVHYAQNGDYSAAGAAYLKTYDTVEENFAEVAIDDAGDYRLLAIGDMKVGKGDLLLAFNHEGGDGPFEVPEGLNKFQGVVKYSEDLGDKTLRLSLLGYTNDWSATDQIPQRAVDLGLISRFGSLDPTLGGETNRFIATAGLEWENAKVMAFAQKYGLDLYGNPTFNIDQTNGDQFIQVDRRTNYGVRGDIKREVSFGGKPTTIRAGGSLQADIIDRVALELTTQRAVTGTIRDDDVTLYAAEAWTDATLHWNEKLRTTVGLRADALSFDVTSNIPQNSGDGSDVTLSPKFSAAYAFTPAFEGYFGFGQGFHSNDVRGDVITLDPATLTPATPVDVFVKATGGEVGVRYQPDETLNLSASYFALNLDSELIFVGDAGTSEPSDATRRQGVELSGFWQPNDAWVFDGQAAWAHARFDDAPSDQDRIPNSVEFAGGLGATWIGPDALTASLRLRYLGEAALIEDNSVRSEPTSIVNLGIEKRFGNIRVGVDALNLLDSDDNDITYYYESQLPGEASPVEDIHFHPVHPRSFRFSLRAYF